MKKILIIFLMVSSYIFSQGKKIERIVTLSPSITEMVIDLGEKDKIVGCDKFSKIHSNLMNIENSLDSNDINEEKIIGLNPDLVIISEHNLIRGQNKIELLKELGIEVELIENPKSVQEIGNSIEKIGKALAQEERGEKLKTEYLNQLKEIKENDKNKSFYLQISSNPLFTSGNKTFLNSALEHIGVKNIFQNGGTWFSPSLENILERNPDIIFVTSEREKNFLLTQGGLKDFFSEKKIILLDENIVLPTPNIVNILKKLNNEI
ncbi:ABC transporter substrate-binding protein [Cetobacterium sp. SF1]|uniref:ABC transporter substrate-binding protein n=1 Tax=Cetobacterium sp. SF1 TaxID=3417654 RepID=UPI003CF58FB1